MYGELTRRELSLVAGLAFIMVCLVALGPLILSSPQSAASSAQLTVVQQPLIPTASAAMLSTTTSQRVIKMLTIPDVIPAQGKFAAADLVNMQLSLYQDGQLIAQYPILTKGKPGTPYETPAGMYSVLTKEENHVNYAEGVNMPYSMEFNGNYFIHGWPTYLDGTPVASTYSGGCIRLSTDDAAKVYAFVDVDTKVFVYDPGAAISAAPLLFTAPAPQVNANSYVVADIDTGDVYAERNAQTAEPVGSATLLMTALVANETIMFDRSLDVSTPNVSGSFVVGDLMYPLLMEQDQGVAAALAGYYGMHAFVSWMNGQAQALDMTSATFADDSGSPAQTTATRDDLYRLANYLANKKAFVLEASDMEQKTLTAADGSSYPLSNQSALASSTGFLGGEGGGSSAVAVYSTLVGGVERRVAIVVLTSSDYQTDVQNLANWFETSATLPQNAGCASCSLPHYRKISL